MAKRRETPQSATDGDYHRRDRVGKLKGYYSSTSIDRTRHRLKTAVAEAARAEEERVAAQQAARAEECSVTITVTFSHFEAIRLKGYAKTLQNLALFQIP